MSSLQPPDYSNTPSGFFQVYSRRKFVGFVSDVEDCNRLYLLTHQISRSEMEQLFKSTVMALHEEWCSDIKKGGGLHQIKRNQFLGKALMLMRGPDVERYWEEKGKESEAAREQEMLIGASRAKVAKQTEAVVAKEQT